LRRFFYTGPAGSFPFCDSCCVALNGPTFRLLVAPTYLVEEFAHVIMMVFHPKLAFDHIGDPLRCPQLRPVTVRHSPFGQEADESLFLLRCQSRRSARRRLGFQRVLPAVLERIAPSQDAARVTTHASCNLVKGQLLFEECYDTFPTLFQRCRRTVRSHGDTPFQEVSIMLHYLCGSQ
jgi:hypothetical protein